MRAVIQRVLNASVTVEGQIVGAIDRGLCILVGLTTDDTTEDLDSMVKKILNVRLFDHEETGRMWGKSVVELDYSVLCVSQFTLYGTVVKGKKPDFHKAMSTQPANEMYNLFLQKMRDAYHPDRIQSMYYGKFGAMMQVALVNDGPVTLQLDTRKFEYIQNNNGNGRDKKTTKEQADS
ncbi:D-Tyr tRNAtyr deacylase-like domain-containing protein [Syncephalis fuscata]|nr:D-Tyr tRNAtyr deacylase-like domain-containing protein [Syncephalis fuscata]